MDTNVSVTAAVVNKYRIKYLLVHYREVSDEAGRTLQGKILGIYDTRAEAIALIESNPNFDVMTSQVPNTYSLSKYNPENNDIGIGFEIKEIFTKEK